MRHLIGGRKQIARRGEIASRVGAAVGELRSAVERGAAANHDGAHRLARMNPAAGTAPSVVSAIKVETPAGKSEGRLVEKVGGKDVRFAQARHLLAQENIDEGERIAGRRMWLRCRPRCKRPRSESVAKRVWSKRAVPKSSRMC